MFSLNLLPRSLKEVGLKCLQLSKISSNFITKSQIPSSMSFSSCVIVDHRNKFPSKENRLGFSHNFQKRNDRNFHLTRNCQDLMEFFDAKENWNKEFVKCGRPWRLEELRIKSNQDLHKLWYILLKERNALMTMQEEYKRKLELMPSPERLFKVDESMQNILAIVNERNEALSQLETGKSVLPEQRTVRNVLGLEYQRTVKEYAVPSWMNKRYSLLHARFPAGLSRYFKLYKEKLRLKEERTQRAKQKRLKHLKELFPHSNIEE